MSERRDLASMECVPCRGGVPPMTHDDAQDYLADLGGEWLVVDDHHLQREYRFKNFRQALAFTNRIGEIAESEGHHPALLTEWGRVTVTWWTHKIRGLHRNDFVMAAKTDKLAR